MDKQQIYLNAVNGLGLKCIPWLMSIKLEKTLGNIQGVGRLLNVGLKHEYRSSRGDDLLRWIGKEVGARVHFRIFFRAISLWGRIFAGHPIETELISLICFGPSLTTFIKGYWQDSKLSEQVTINRDLNYRKSHAPKPRQ